MARNWATARLPVPSNYYGIFYVCVGWRCGGFFSFKVKTLIILLSDGYATDFIGFFFSCISWRIEGKTGRVS